MIQKLLITALFILFSNVLTSAQGHGGGEPKGRVAYFVCTQFPVGFQNPILVRTGQKIHRVELSKRTASEPIKFSSNGEVEIVKQRENPAEGEDPYKIIGKATIAPDTKKALIILRARSEERALDKYPHLYDMTVQDLKKFSKGDYLYVNLSPAKIAVSLDKKSILVKPRSSAIYKAGDLTKPKNVVVSYGFLSREKKWKTLSSSTIVLRPTRREICVFSWNKKFQRLSYHGITFTEMPE